MKNNERFKQCFLCKARPEPFDYQVKDHVWEEAGFTTYQGIAHLRCFANALGRPLTIQDFTERCRRDLEWVLRNLSLNPVEKKLPCRQGGCALFRKPGSIWCGNHG